MQKQVMNHKWLIPQSKIILDGVNFPINSINGILLSNVDREKVLVSKNKDKILSFIRSKKKVYFSEIGEKFNLDLVTVKLILNKLEEEGKINLNK